MLPRRLRAFNDMKENVFFFEPSTAFVSVKFEPFERKVNKFLCELILFPIFFFFGFVFKAKCPNENR